MLERIFLQPILQVDDERLFQIFLMSRPDLFQLSMLDTIESNVILRQQFDLSQMYTTETESSSRFLIQYQGQCVGKLYLKHEEVFDEVVSIAILPQYRNLGIGRQLLQSVIENAIRQNKDVRLRVAWYNNDAKRLYERLGFIETMNYQVYCDMSYLNRIDR